ncbi:Cell division coordinator CpoB [Hydrogenovibrio crunogenus]|uniref:Cell division coordinator CpoB n=1 Tax=Hydrogenovibrio crunogenus TaxID=39765 RepID=A0A4P7NYP1_9GAMM|nr:tol-pal system protein YbgF [Hydrogenovibrio crunogenus]QBZ82921.1 Cell division coordinator CpoB [Hydrogenovibrio crunogenus]
MKKTLSLIITTAILNSVMPVASAAPQPIEERVQRLERMADNPVLIQLSRRLAEQQRQIQSLYDEVDRLNYQLKQTQEKLAKQYKEADERLSVLEASQSSASNVQDGGSSSVLVPEETSTESQGKDVATASSSSTSGVMTHSATAKEKRVYEAAFALMKKSDYQGASKAFSAFKASYPNSDLASNSAYWEGEAEAVLGNDKAALKAFIDVYETYPTSLKAPAAMLRAADMYQEVGEKKKAKALYEQLIQDYPKKNVAEKARKRLSAMGVK